MECKLRGNDYYAAGRYDDAVNAYTEAIARCPEENAAALTVLFANRAAAHLMIQRYKEARDDATFSLTHDKRNVKALMRRASAAEALDDLANALTDYEAALTVDADNRKAEDAIRRLRPAVDARNAALKSEMLDKLKAVGGGLLSKFGLSLDQFKAVQDPTTGAYSISYGNK